jgi:hypothetical protein
MTKTFCDYCGREIEDSNHQVNFDINAYGCAGFFPKEYNYHVECGRKIENLLKQASCEICQEDVE